MTVGLRSPTGPADLRDQQWLDEQVLLLGDGIAAAQAIWANWREGRNVGRLHPGQNPGEYIESMGLRLTLPEALVVAPNASSRQIAAIAAVSSQTVRNRRGDQDWSPDATVVGKDGKHYPARRVAVVLEPTPEQEASWPEVVAVVVDTEWFMPLRLLRVAAQKGVRWVEDPETAIQTRSPEHLTQVREMVEEIASMIETIKQEVGS